ARKGGSGLWIVALVLVPFLLGAGALGILLGAAAVFFLVNPRPAAPPPPIFTAEAVSSPTGPAEHPAPEKEQRETPKVDFDREVKPVPDDPPRPEPAPRPPPAPPLPRM